MINDRIPEDDRESHADSRGPHLQPPSEALVGWSIVGGCAAAIVLIILTVLLVMFASKGAQSMTELPASGTRSVTGGAQSMTEAPSSGTRSVTGSLR